MVVCFSAPIKLDNKPKVEQANDGSNSVNLTWLPPVNNSGLKETIFYDIFCYVCNQSNCNKSCADVTYNPKQYNLTGTHAVVSGLVHGQTYEFRIYPKNSLNKVVPRDEWNFTATKPFIFERKGETIILVHWFNFVILGYSAVSINPSLSTEAYYQ